MSPVKDWAIIGGGFLGMTLALRLAEAGQRVTLYEAAPHLGGLASAWQVGDVVWDRHYHVTLLSDSSLRSLLEELGLEKDMNWVESRTGVYSGGQLYPVSNTIDFLRFPPLRLVDKFRLGVTILVASRIKDWRKLETKPVGEWLRRWSGGRTYSTFWLPLLKAKLGENYRRASAAFIWAVIQRLYAARRTGLKKEMFGYVPGGYARILETFGDVLEKAGVQIELGSRVGAIERDANSVRVKVGEDSRIHDEVVVTAVPSIAARLIEGLSVDEVEAYDGLSYQGIVCASLVLKRPLADYYVTNITDDWVPFTGVIEMSSLVDNTEFGGDTLVYLPRYVDSADPYLDASDADVQREFIEALDRMYPNFSPEDVIAFKVSRVRYVLPIPTIGYSDRVPPIDTSVPGVHAVSSAHIVNGTLNVNETILLAERAAAELLTASGSTPLRSKAR